MSASKADVAAAAAALSKAQSAANSLHHPDQKPATDNLAAAVKGAGK